MRRWLPVLACALALVLYAASAPLVHRGDAVGFLLEIRTGLAHDPGHLLARPWAALWVTLLPVSSAWWALWAVAATGGALVTGLVCRWLLERDVHASAAVVASLVSAVCYGAWSTSVTFEDHSWPLAMSWLAVLALERRRAVLAGVAWGLALSLHVMAAGAVGALLVLALGHKERATVLLTAGGTVQLAHLATFLLPWGEQQRPPLFYPAAVVAQSQQLAGTEAIAPGGMQARPLAWLEGLQAGLLAPVGAPSVWLGAVALLMVAAAVLASRTRWSRPLGALLVWALCTLPLALWVGPSNYEYYRATWTALVAVLALCALPWPRASAGVGLVGFAALLVLNSRVIGRDWHSPTGAAVGLRNGPQGPEWVQDPGAP